MDELSSIWTTREESVEDLKQKILSTNLELESLKKLATESQQDADMILGLLQVAYKERDEARNELQKALNKMNPISASVKQFPNAVQPESPIFIPPKVNSGISEPTSLFEACINDTSLVDSLFDAVSSPELSNINDSNHMSLLNQPLTKELTRTTVSTPTGVGLDAEFDYNRYIAKGKSLPQKGKLLQAVTDAGPLLKTLLVTAPPLPRWQNAPAMQPPKLSLSRQGCKEILASVSEKPVAKSSSCHGFTQTCSANNLDSSNVSSVISCKSSRPLNSSSSLDQQIIPAARAKRCRLQ